MIEGRKEAGYSLDRRIEKVSAPRFKPIQALPDVLICLPANPDGKVVTEICRTAGWNANVSSYSLTYASSRLLRLRKETFLCLT